MKISRWILFYTLLMLHLMLLFRFFVVFGLGFPWCGIWCDPQNPWSHSLIQDILGSFKLCALVAIIGALPAKLICFMLDVKSTGKGLLTYGVAEFGAASIVMYVYMKFVEMAFGT